MNRGTHFAVDLVLFVLALLLDHEDRVIEKEHLQFGTLALCPASLLEWTLVDELSFLVPQSKILI